MGLTGVSLSSLACPDRSPWWFLRPTAARTCSAPLAAPPKRALDRAPAAGLQCTPSPRTARVSRVSIPPPLTPPADVDAEDAAAAAADGAEAASRSGRATAAAFTICKAAAFTPWPSAQAARTLERRRRLRRLPDAVAAGADAAV